MDKLEQRIVTDEGNLLLGDLTNQRRKSRWLILISDFANMVKAFIGSNYLSVAYAFTQSGLVMGLVLLTIVALVTDHCCDLIVKCKYTVIQKVLENRHHSAPLTGKKKYYNENGDPVENRHTLEEQMTKTLSYGDIGKTAFGAPGVTVVNACLLFTQFGFSVAYFIFIGNTLYTLFPYRNTTVPTHTMPSGFSQTHNSSGMYNVSSLVLESTAPDLRLLVLVPLPFFIVFAFLRRVRHLGAVSVLANVSILLGCVVTLSFVST
ncbi:proton-coupled amino acid transporter 1-like, partial [Physella acuta]|uniref:proton-coupled amino acid transporter 1-like n=1 Tax=Physella acuta TaxID=109671 RepID=UPI0027DC52F8